MRKGTPELAFDLEMIKSLSEADHALGELAGVGRMLPNPYYLVGPAIRREAVMSSRIEGTQTGMSDLFFFEANPEAPPRHEDVREVWNYVEALQYGLSRLATLPVSLRLIREVHGMLMKGVRGAEKKPGEFRTQQNWIGAPGCSLDEAVFVPPPQEELLEVLDALETFVHSPSELPVLIRLALIHSQFEMIHPFADGNGRIGRLLIPLLLCTWGILGQPLLYLSAFFEKFREAYYDLLLAVSQKGEFEPWVKFFLRGIREQSEVAVKTANALLDLQRRFREMMKGRRISKVTLSILDQLFVNPVVSASFITEKCKVSFRTAQKVIEDLEESEILREITGYRRNRLWEAKDILEIISPQD